MDNFLDFLNNIRMITKLTATLILKFSIPRIPVNVHKQRCAALPNELITLAAKLQNVNKREEFGNTNN